MTDHPTPSIVTWLGALSRAIANMPCACTDYASCEAHRLLEDHAHPPVAANPQEVAQLRGKVYAALIDEKPIRTLFGRRWLDAPEAERIAAVAVSAVLGLDGTTS